MVLNKKGEWEWKKSAANAKKNAQDANSSGQVNENKTGNEALDQVTKDAVEKSRQDAALRQSKKDVDRLFEGSVAAAYKRHAAIKYLNMKYAGRVVTIDMAFNPFVMCGFPGAIISAMDSMDTNVTKTIIGMVQQVSHTIYITTESAEAATTVVMNNARFEDEPTDLNELGMPLYIEPTNRVKAEIDPNTYEFIGGPNYRVPEAKSPFALDKESDSFDLKEIKIDQDYPYVKDFLSTSAMAKDENVYVDMSYEPNRISRFYTQVFGHANPHFMLGKHSDERGTHYFAYNSMHEAFTELRKNNRFLTDYGYCINFVKRNICSANSFYHAILGLSSRSQDSDSYINNPAGDNDSEEPIRYYGVPSDKVSEISKELNIKAGGFSSIRESLPVTAIIKERRDAVEKYFEAIKEYSNRGL
jgi:hypothetical protein